MSGLFSQNNLLLCGMQGNNGFPKSPIQLAWLLLLTSAKFAVQNGDCLNNIINELSF